MKRLQIAMLVADVVLIGAAVVLMRRIREMQKQAWFWTPEWQAREAEATEDILAGRVTVFKDGEDFLRAMGEACEAPDRHLAHA